MAVRSPIGIAVFGQQLNGKGYTIYTLSEFYNINKVDEESRDRLLQLPNNVKYSIGTTIYSVNQRRGSSRSKAKIYLVFNMYKFGGLDKQDRPTYYGVSIAINQEEMSDITLIYDYLHDLIDMAKQKHNDLSTDLKSKINEIELSFAKKASKPLSIGVNSKKDDLFGILFEEDINNRKKIVSIFNKIVSNLILNYRTIFVSNYTFEIDKFTSLYLIEEEELVAIDEKVLNSEDKVEKHAVASEPNNFEDAQEKEPQLADLDEKEEETTKNIEEENSVLQDDNYSIETGKSKIIETSNKIAELEKIYISLEKKIEKKQVSLGKIIKRTKIFKQFFKTFLFFYVSVSFALCILAFYIGKSFSQNSTNTDENKQTTETANLPTYDNTNPGEIIQDISAKIDEDSININLPPTQKQFEDAYVYTNEEKSAAMLRIDEFLEYATSAQLKVKSIEDFGHDLSSYLMDKSEIIKNNFNSGDDLWNEIKRNNPNSIRKITNHIDNNLHSYSREGKAPYVFYNKGKYWRDAIKGNTALIILRY